LRSDVKGDSVDDGEGTMIGFIWRLMEMVKRLGKHSQTRALHQLTSLFFHFVSWNLVVFPFP